MRSIHVFVCSCFLARHAHLEAQQSLDSLCENKKSMVAKALLGAGTYGAFVRKRIQLAGAAARADRGYEADLKQVLTILRGVSCLSPTQLVAAMTWNNSVVVRWYQALELYRSVKNGPTRLHAAQKSNMASATEKCSSLASAAVNGFVLRANDEFNMSVYGDLFSRMDPDPLDAGARQSLLSWCDETTGRAFVPPTIKIDKYFEDATVKWCATTHDWFQGLASHTKAALDALQDVYAGRFEGGPRMDELVPLLRSLFPEDEAAMRTLEFRSVVGVRMTVRKRLIDTLVKGCADLARFGMEHSLHKRESVNLDSDTLQRGQTLVAQCLPAARSLAFACCIMQHETVKLEDSFGDHQSSYLALQTCVSFVHSRRVRRSRATIAFWALAFANMCACTQRMRVGLSAILSCSIHVSRNLSCESMIVHIAHSSFGPKESGDEIEASWPLLMAHVITITSSLAIDKENGREYTASLSALREAYKDMSTFQGDWAARLRSAIASFPKGVCDVALAASQSYKTSMSTCIVAAQSIHFGALLDGTDVDKDAARLLLDGSDATTLHSGVKALRQSAALATAVHTWLSDQAIGIVETHSTDDCHRLKEQAAAWAASRDSLEESDGAEVGRVLGNCTALQILLAPEEKNPARLAGRLLASFDGDQQQHISAN